MRLSRDCSMLSGADIDNVSVVKVAASNCLTPSGLPPKRMRERRLERYHRRVERFGVA